MSVQSLFEKLLKELIGSGRPKKPKRRSGTKRAAPQKVVPSEIAPLSPTAAPVQQAPSNKMSAQAPARDDTIYWMDL